MHGVLGGTLVLKGTQSEVQNGPYEFLLVGRCTPFGCTIQNSPCEFQKILDVPQEAKSTYELSD